MLQRIVLVKLPVRRQLTRGLDIRGLRPRSRPAPFQARFARVKIPDAHAKRPSRATNSQRPDVGFRPDGQAGRSCAILWRKDCFQVEVYTKRPPMGRDDRSALRFLELALAEEVHRCW
jgi:hypothetical protein